jgi:hypothetical protein
MVTMAAAKRGYLGKTIQTISTNVDAGAKASLSDAFNFVTSPSQWIPAAIAVGRLTNPIDPLGITVAGSVVIKLSKKDAYTLENISYVSGYAAGTIATAVVADKGISKVAQLGRTAAAMDAITTGVTEGLNAFGTAEVAATKTAGGAAVAEGGVAEGVISQNLSVEKVLDNPYVLEGKSLTEVKNTLEKSSNWVEGTLNKGRSAGKGWTLRELNANGTDYTGRFIQYSPGSSRHFNGNAYWKVSTGVSGTERVAADAAIK